ncbi:hypothetical protein L227DRAFT_551440 [Lentinus tigrinus ALCF2SS1-6]|uniref:Uncharacterized protein n=2 Tax=Lentinus tigrinus TaxID=5365 RepID=A0A5C2S3A3_9APHY|nr:hypothetical protein L227DRAFT_551440 [Lentinus tigrinus ALCF2SS1-6]
MSDKLMIPLPCRYAAVRLNLMAMVADLGLGDEVTLTEARRFKPKTYLAFLFHPGELPIPGMRWCRYKAELIGTTLRTAIPEQGITSDMVVPIAPNCFHPHGRKPVHSTPPFPLANCFHWVENDVTVRIRMREDGFEHNGSFKVNFDEHLAMMRSFEEDYERIGAFYRAQEEEEEARSHALDPQGSEEPTATSQGKQPTSEDFVNHIISAGYLRYAQEEGVMTSTLPDGREAGTKPDSNSDSCSSSTLSPTSSFDDELINVFGLAPDPTTGLIPLMDAWLDIDQHLTADTIPSPDELENEVETMIQIIKRGVTRRLLADKTQVYVDTVNAALQRASRSVDTNTGQSDTSSQRPARVVVESLAPRHPALWTSHLGWHVWHIAAYSTHLLSRRMRKGLVPMFKWMVEVLAKAFTRQSS